MLWKNVIFVLIGLVLIGSIGYSATTIKTDKDVYYCVAGNCKPVQINITTDLTLYTVKINWDTSAGYISTAKLPYLTTTALTSVTIASAVLPKTSSISFYFNATAYGNVKFNISVYDGLGKLVSRLDPFLINYNNRMQFNVSTTAGNYFNFSLPIVLNNSNWGNNACAVSECNDTAVTDLNNEPYYYYIENYTALGNSVIIAKLPFLNATEQQLYVYYNSTNATRSSYYDASRAYDQYDDFNYISADPKAEWTAGAGFLTDGEYLVSGAGGWAYMYWNTKSLFHPYLIETLVNSTGLGVGAGTAGILWGYNGTSSGSLVGIGDLGGARLLFTNGGSAGGSGAAETLAPLILKVIVNTTNSSLYTNNALNLTSAGLGSNNGASGGLAYYDQGVIHSWDWYRARQIIYQPLLTFTMGEEEIPPLSADYLQINYYSPDLLDINESCDSVNISIIPISSLPLINCSIWWNNSDNYTFDSPTNNTLLSLIYALDNGTYNFSWDCYAGDLYNTTQNYTLNVMCAYPVVNYSVCNLYMLPTDFTFSYCLNNNTLYHEKTYTMGGLNCNYSEVETCKYGCEGDKCNLSLEVARTNTFYLIILLFAAILIVAMIAKFYR